MTSHDPDDFYEVGGFLQPRCKCGWASVGLYPTYETARDRWLDHVDDELRPEGF